MEEMYKMEGNEGRGTTPPHLCVLYHSITSPTTFHPLYVVHENNVLGKILISQLIINLWIYYQEHLTFLQKMQWNDIEYNDLRYYYV